MSNYFRRLFFLLASLFLISSQLIFASENPKQVSKAVEPVNLVDICAKMKKTLDSNHIVRLPSLTILNKLNFSEFGYNLSDKNKELYNKFKDTTDIILKKIDEQGVIKNSQLNSVNKDQLIRTYASIYEDNYDLIWFFDRFAKHRDFKDGLSALAKKISTLENSNIHLQLQLKFDPEMMVVSYLQNKSRWLLVFDKCCYEDFMYNDVDRFIKKLNNNGHIIINYECQNSSLYTSWLKVVFASTLRSYNY